jgi:hypothetical protein
MRIDSIILLAIPAVYAADETVWDFAPSFAGDAIQPYPDLTGSDGNNISVDSLRGTHLFGWKGCTGERAKLIKQAYNDFYTLANQLEVYNNIDWSGQAATDFWGPADGKYKIPDNTREEIAREYRSSKDVLHWTGS